MKIIGSTLPIKIVKCVGALKMKKCVESLQKQTVGPIFNIRNSQLLTWSLPTEEFLQIHGESHPVANLLDVNFRSHPRENAITKATEYVAFGFSFRILVFLPF